jgi:hypothetical protein
MEEQAAEALVEQEEMTKVYTEPLLPPEEPAVHNQPEEPAVQAVLLEKRVILTGLLPAERVAGRPVLSAVAELPEPQ